MPPRTQTAKGKEIGSEDLLMAIMADKSSAKFVSDATKGDLNCKNVLVAIQKVSKFVGVCP